MNMRVTTRLSALAVLAALAALSTPAQAWWGPYGWVPPRRPPVVVVAPPVIYAPRVVYARPPAIWVSPRWYGGVFYPGHWR